MDERGSSSIKKTNQRNRGWVTILGMMILNGLLILPLWGGGIHAALYFPSEPFNILLITIDALRPDHLSCYGYRKIQTRNIDQLAAKGVLFEKALSTSPWTAPSIASLLTSLYPSVHGVRKGVALDPGFKTLTEILALRGFRTYAIVTNPHISGKMNLKQGFERYEFLGSNPISKYLLSRDSAEVVTEKAIRWLRRSQKERFFLWLHYNDPHIPYGFPNRTILPAYDKGYAGDMDNHFYAVRALRDGSLRLSKEDKRHIQALYDADILYADRYVGLLLREIKRLGISGKTIVFLTSDHGEEFWDHNGFEHGHSLYQEVIRVPLIVIVPGIKGGPKRIAQQVRLIDLKPTILDILDIQGATVMQGKSLLPLMMTGQDVYERIAFSESILYGKEKKAIRNQNHTLIYESETGDVELFDTLKDPFEKANRASHNKGMVDRLLLALERWSRACSLLSASIQRKDPVKGIDLKEHEKKLRELGYIE